MSRTLRQHRAIAAAYYRAIVAGRPVQVAAKRMGVDPSYMRRIAEMWPEHLDRLRNSTTLRLWERENLNRYLKRRDNND